MVTHLCPLCKEVSQMNSTIAHTLSQNQTLHLYVAYNWSFGYFCDFLPILAKIWLPRQRPLDIAIRNVFFGLVGHENPVMSNHILVMSCRNAFMCTYSNFSPKIGCHGNSPLSLVYGSVTDEIPDVTNPTSEPISAWICCIQLKLWLLMAALCNRGASIFLPCSFFLSSSSIFFLCLPCDFFLSSIFFLFLA